MAQRNLIMSLAKVIIAVAWADRQLSTEEVNHLKRLLLRVPVGSNSDGVLTANESAELDVYLHSPVSGEERNALIANLRDQIKAPHERQLALALIEELISADGVVTPDERGVLKHIRSTLDPQSTNPLIPILRTFGFFNDPQPPTLPREELIGDYVNNRIFFNIRQQILVRDEYSHIGLSDETARQMSLGLGMLLLVAIADGPLNDEERVRIEATLHETWGLSDLHFKMIRDVIDQEINDLSLFQLTNQYRLRTNHVEQLNLLNHLCITAISDGEINAAESAIIGQIANSFGMRNEELIAAKEYAKKFAKRLA